MARGSLSDFFVWGGGGSQLTPEEIAQRRKVEAAILARGVDTSPIGHWTQGAARVADAIAGAFRRGQLEEDATANNEYNSDIVNSLLGSPSSATSTPASSAATSGVSQELAAASPTPVVAEGEIADYIRQSATARGIDPDVALRVAMSEGGLKDPVRQSDYVKNGVREASYGPFQLYMGGGLGNKALEAGIDPRDPNQWKQGVDFALDQAAKGGWSPWYGAAKVGIGNRTGLDNARAIGFAPRSAPTPAAAAIETVAPASGYVDPMVSAPNALPAAPASAFDAGRFGEGAPVSAMPEVYSAQTDFAPPLPAPTTINPAPPVASVPQQVAQAQPQTNPAAIAQALRVMADPRANEGTRRVAQVLIQQEQQKQQFAQEQAVWQQRQEYERAQQASDPLRQLQIQQAQINLEKARNPQQEIPDAVQSLRLRAQEAGLQPGTPEYQNFFITQGVRPPSTISSPPSGYRYDYDANGNPVSVSPIPGGPAALEAEERKRVLGNQQSGRETSTDVITNAANLAREAVNAPGLPSTGTIGNLLSGLPETNASELRRQVSVLTSNATVENLNAMRQASPTGGALGSVTEKEGAMLAAKSGALDPNSPNFMRDLDDYEKTLLRIVHGQEKGDEIYRQTRTSGDPDIQAAKDAIARGADRGAVIKRLRDAGKSTEGL